MQVKENLSSLNYEELSQILKIFRSTVKHLQKIILTNIKNEPVTHLLWQVKQQVSRIQDLMRKLATSSTDKNRNLSAVDEATAKKRLCMRLLQQISYFQNQYLQRSFFLQIKLYLMSIEKIVQEFRQHENLSIILSNMRLHFIKVSEILLKEKVTSQQLKFSNMVNTEKNLSSKLVQSSLLDRTNLTETNYKKQFVPKALQKFINQTATNLKMFSGMDIDTNHYKNLFFQFKNKSNNHLEQSCMERNKIAIVQRRRYLEQYNTFYKKKSFKKKKFGGFKKLENKLHTSLSIENGGEEEKSNLPIKIFENRHQFIPRRTFLMNRIQTETVNENSDKDQFSIEKRNSIKSYQKKTSLEMRNLLLTGNYFNSIQYQYAELSSKYFEKHGTKFLMRAFHNCKTSLISKYRYKRAAAAN